MVISSNSLLTAKKVTCRSSHRHWQTEQIISHSKELYILHADGSRICQDQKYLQGARLARRKSKASDNASDVQSYRTLVPLAYKPFPELTRDSGRIAQENEIDRQVQAIRRGRSVGLLDALEEGFYWLISAAVLAYLALGIFGLWNFTLSASTPDS